MASVSVAGSSRILLGSLLGSLPDRRSFRVGALPSLRKVGLRRYRSLLECLGATSGVCEQSSLGVRINLARRPLGRGPSTGRLEGLGLNRFGLVTRRCNELFGFLLTPGSAFSCSLAPSRFASRCSVALMRSASIVAAARASSSSCPASARASLTNRSASASAFSLISTASSRVIVAWARIRSFALLRQRSPTHGHLVQEMVDSVVKRTQVTVDLPGVIAPETVLEVLPDDAVAI